MFGVSPALLTAQKEYFANVKFIMEYIINLEVKLNEQNGLQHPHRWVHVRLIRSMLDECVGY